MANTRASLLLKLKRAVALFLCLSLPATGISWSAPEARMTPFAARISIPETLGRIQEVYTPSLRVEQMDFPTVIQIQDAHANLQAQQSIQKLIDYLHQHYGIQTLLLEGATQPLVPELYQIFEQPEANRKLAERLLEMGELTGAEVFLADHPSLSSSGIEDSDSYIRNVRLFRQILRHESAIENFTRHSRASLAAQISRQFNRRLRKFFKLADRFYTSDGFLQDFFETLRQFAVEDLKVDLNNPRQQFEYPMLARYFRVKALEREIQPERTKQDKERLIDWLSRLSLRDRRPKPSAVTGLSPKTPDIRGVLEDLYRETSSQGFRFEDYPDWTKQAALWGLTQEIEAKPLMEEAGHLANKIFDALAKTGKEKELLERYRKMLLLEKLLQLKLTREDWEKVKGDRLLFPPRREKQPVPFYLYALQFYQTAEARENYFIRNLKIKMKVGKADQAILVAGGFHSAGLQEKLKAEGFAYVTILPHMNEFDPKKEQKIYRDTMLESSSVQHFLRMQPLGSMSPQEKALVNPAYRLRQLQRAMAGIAAPLKKNRSEARLAPKELKSAKTIQEEIGSAEQTIKALKGILQSLGSGKETQPQRGAVKKNIRDFKGRIKTLRQELESARLRPKKSSPAPAPAVKSAAKEPASVPGEIIPAPEGSAAYSLARAMRNANAGDEIHYFGFFKAGDEERAITIGFRERITEFIWDVKKQKYRRASKKEEKVAHVLRKESDVGWVLYYFGSFKAGNEDRLMTVGDGGTAFELIWDAKRRKYRKAAENEEKLAHAVRKAHGGSKILYFGFFKAGNEERLMTVSQGHKVFEFIWDEKAVEYRQVAANEEKFAHELRKKLDFLEGFYFFGSFKAGNEDRLVSLGFAGPNEWIWDKKEGKYREAKGKEKKISPALKKSYGNSFLAFNYLGHFKVGDEDRLMMGGSEGSVFEFIWDAKQEKYREAKGNEEKLANLVREAHGETESVVKQFVSFFRNGQTQYVSVGERTIASFVQPHVSVSRRARSEARSEEPSSAALSSEALQEKIREIGDVIANLESMRERFGTGGDRDSSLRRVALDRNLANFKAQLGELELEVQKRRREIPDTAALELAQIEHEITRLETQKAEGLKKVLGINLALTPAPAGSRADTLANSLRAAYPHSWVYTLSSFFVGREERFMSVGNNGEVFEFLFDQGKYRQARPEEERLANVVREAHEGSWIGAIAAVDNEADGKTYYVSVGEHGKAFEFIPDGEGFRKALPGEEKIADQIRSAHNGSRIVALYLMEDSVQPGKFRYVSAGEHRDAWEYIFEESRYRLAQRSEEIIADALRSETGGFGKKYLATFDEGPELHIVTDEDTGNHKIFTFTRPFFQKQTNFSVPEQGRLDRLIARRKELQDSFVTHVERSEARSQKQNRDRLSNEEIEAEIQKTEAVIADLEALLEKVGSGKDEDSKQRRKALKNNLAEFRADLGAWQKELAKRPKEKRPLAPSRALRIVPRSPEEWIRFFKENRAGSLSQTMKDAYLQFIAEKNVIRVRDKKSNSQMIIHYRPDQSIQSIEILDVHGIPMLNQNLDLSHPMDVGYIFEFPNMFSNFQSAGDYLHYLIMVIKDQDVKEYKKRNPHGELGKIKLVSLASNWIWEIISESQAAQRYRDLKDIFQFKSAAPSRDPETLRAQLLQLLVKEDNRSAALALLKKGDFLKPLSAYKLSKKDKLSTGSAILIVMNKRPLTLGTVRSLADPSGFKEEVRLDKTFYFNLQQYGRKESYTQYDPAMIDIFLLASADEVNRILRARSEARASKTVFDHPAFKLIQQYYQARSQLPAAIVRGDAALYQKTLQEMLEASRKVKKMIRSPKTLRALMGTLKKSPKLPFDRQWIEDELEILYAAGTEFPESVMQKFSEDAAGFLSILGYDRETREDLLRKINQITYPLTLENLLPSSIEAFAYDPEMLHAVAANLEHFLLMGSRQMRGGVIQNPTSDKDYTIQILEADPVSMRSTHLHEIIHYLALENVLPFDGSRELITSAVSAVISQGEKSFEAFLAKLKGDLANIGKAYEKSLKLGLEHGRAGKRLMLPAEIEQVIRRLAQEEIPDFATWSETAVQDLAERLSGYYLGGYGWAKSGKESDSLRFVVDYGKRYLPRVRNTAYNRKLTPRDWHYIDSIVPTLRSLARVTLKNADDRVHLAPRTRKDLRSLDRTRWFYDPEPQRMDYIPWDIIEYGPDGSKGIALQEIFRANHSEESLIEEPLASDTAFRLLYGVAETSRVVTQGLAENPGRVAEIDTFYRKKLRIFDLEIEKERTADEPKFVQYIEALFYTLALSENPKKPALDPRLTDPEVHAIVKKTFTMILQALAEDAATFYKTLRDQVWPEVQKLLEKDKKEAIRDEAEQEALNKLIEEGQFEMEFEPAPPPPAAGTSAAPALPPPGEKLKIKITPPAPGAPPNPLDLSDKAKKMLDQKMEELLKDKKIREELERRAEEALREKVEEEAGGLADVTSDQEPERSSRGRAGKKSPGFSPPPMPEPPQPGESSGTEGMRGDIEDLERLTQEIQDQAGEIEKSVGNSAKDAQEMDAKAGKIDRSGGAATANGQTLEQGIKDLIKKLKTLRQKTDEFQDRSDSVGEKLEELEQNAGENSAARQEILDKMKDLGDEISRLGREMQQEAAESDRAAQEAAASGRELEEKLEKNPEGVEGIKGRAKRIQEKMQAVQGKLREIQERAEEADGQAGNLHDEAEDFEERLEKPLPEVGEEGPENQDLEAGDAGFHFQKRNKKARPSGTPRAPSSPQKGPAPHFDPNLVAALREFMEDTEDLEVEIPDQGDQRRAIEKLTGLNDHERQTIELIRSVAREYEGTLRENILSAIQEHERSARLTHQRKGRLDSRRLPLIPTGIKDPFVRNLDPQKKKLRLSLLLDVSGSMFSDPLNFDLQDMSQPMLRAKNRINNAVKVALLLMEIFRNDPRVELEIGLFARAQKIILPFGTPIDDGVIYRVIETILNHGLGGHNSDLAGLRMMVNSLRKRDREEGPQPKILVVIADGGINGFDAEGIQQTLTKNEDIVFLPAGIGPESANVAMAYAPFGKAVPDLSQLVSEIGNWILEQGTRLLGLLGDAGFLSLLVLLIPQLLELYHQGAGAGSASLAALVFLPALLVPKKVETENFITVDEGGKTYLKVKGNRYPNFKAEINGEGTNIPQVNLFETETNVKDVVKIIKRTQRQNLDRSILYVEGEAGTAKNKKIYYAAKLLRRNVRFMAMHKEIHEDDLVERRGVNEKEIGKTDWIPSPIVEAMIHGDWVILDEANKTEPQVLKRLNQIIQSRRVVLHNGTVVTAKEGFTVIMTGNPPPTGNDEKVYEVNRESAEWLDRLRPLVIKYLPANEEIQLLYAILMEQRGYKKPDEIPPSERDIIKRLVETANEIRDRYFGTDPATGTSLGRGKLIARPMSTRALVNIVKRLAGFPDEAKRMRAVIAKFYSYDWEDTAKRTNAQNIIHNKFSADKPYELKGLDLQGPRYVTKAGGKQVLQFAGIEIETGPHAPKDMADIPLDMQASWTESNLHYLREMMMDFKQGHHMLFIGELGTGKSLLAEYISYLLHGPVVETFGVTSNTMVEDLTAYLGIGEGERVGSDGLTLAVGKHETGLVPAYVVRAMRAGRPVILDELNAGKPEVVAVLNNILEYGWIDLANGQRVYAQPGFVIIGNMNPSNKQIYLGVHKLSGEFLDRFSAYKMDYLAPEEEVRILADFNRLLLRHDPEVFQILNEEFLKRLVKAAGQLRREYGNGRLPRPVSMRGMKRLIVTLSEYPEEYDDLEELVLQEGFFFRDPAHAGLVKKAVQDAKFEEVDNLVMDLDVVREPASGDAGVDKILRTLQQTVKPGPAADQIRALRAKTEELLAQEEDWNKLDFGEKLSRVSILKEIYQSVLVIQEARSDKKTPKKFHSVANLELLNQIQVLILGRLTRKTNAKKKEDRGYGWPESALTSAETLKDWAGRHKSKGTKDPVMDDLLGKMNVFSRDIDYFMELSGQLSGAGRSEMRATRDVSALKRQIAEDEQLLKQIVDLSVEIKERHGKRSGQFKTLAESINEIKKRLNKNRQILTKRAATAHAATPVSAKPAAKSKPSIRLVPRIFGEVKEWLEQNPIEGVSARDGNIYLRSFSSRIMLHYNQTLKNIFRSGGSLTFFHDLEILDAALLPQFHLYITTGIQTREIDHGKILIIVTNRSMAGYKGPRQGNYAPARISWEVLSESQAVARYEELKDVLKFESAARSEVRNVAPSPHLADETAVRHYLSDLGLPFQAKLLELENSGKAKIEAYFDLEEIRWNSGQRFYYASPRTGARTSVFKDSGTSIPYFKAEGQLNGVHDHNLYWPRVQFETIESGIIGIQVYQPYLQRHFGGQGSSLHYKIFAPEELGLDESVGDVEVIYSNFKAPSVLGGLSPVIRIADDVFELDSTRSYVHKSQRNLRFIVFRSLPDEAVPAQPAQAPQAASQVAAVFETTASQEVADIGVLKRQIAEDEQLVKQIVDLSVEIKQRHGKRSGQFKTLAASVREIQGRLRKNRKELASAVAPISVKSAVELKSLVRLVPRTKEELWNYLESIFSRPLSMQTGPVAYHSYHFEGQWSLNIGIDSESKIKFFGIRTLDGSLSGWSGEMPHPDSLDFLDMGYNAKEKRFYLVAPDFKLERFKKLNGNLLSGTVASSHPLGIRLSSTPQTLFHWEIISESDAVARYEELKDILKFEPVNRSETRETPEEIAKLEKQVEEDEKFLEGLKQLLADIKERHGGESAQFKELRSRVEEKERELAAKKAGLPKPLDKEIAEVEREIILLKAKIQMRNLPAAGIYPGEEAPPFIQTMVEAVHARDRTIWGLDLGLVQIQHALKTSWNFRHFLTTEKDRQVFEYYELGGQYHKVSDFSERIVKLIRKAHGSNWVFQWTYSPHHYMSVGEKGMAWEYLPDGQGGFRIAEKSEEEMAGVIRQAHNGSTIYYFNFFDVDETSPPRGISLGEKGAVYEYIKEAGKYRLALPSEEKLAPVLRQEYDQWRVYLFEEDGTLTFVKPGEGWSSSFHPRAPFFSEQQISEFREQLQALTKRLEELHAAKPVVSPEQIKQKLELVEKSLAEWKWEKDDRSHHDGYKFRLVHRISTLHDPSGKAVYRHIYYDPSPSHHESDPGIKKEVLDEEAYQKYLALEAERESLRAALAGQPQPRSEVRAARPLLRDDTAVADYLKGLAQGIQARLLQLEPEKNNTESFILDSQNPVAWHSPGQTIVITAEEPSRHTSLYYPYRIRVNRLRLAGSLKINNRFWESSLDIADQSMFEESPEKGRHETSITRFRPSGMIDRYKGNPNSRVDYGIFPPEILGLNKSVGPVEILWTDFKFEEGEGFPPPPVIRVADDAFKYSKVRKSFVHTAQKKVRFIVFRNVPEPKGPAGPTTALAAESLMDSEFPRDKEIGLQRQIGETEIELETFEKLLEQLETRHGKQSDQAVEFRKHVEHLQKKLAAERRELQALSEWSEKLRIIRSEARNVAPSPPLADEMAVRDYLSDLGLPFQAKLLELENSGKAIIEAYFDLENMGENFRYYASPRTGARTSVLKDSGPSGSNFRAQGRVDGVPEHRHWPVIQFKTIDNGIQIYRPYLERHFGGQGGSLHYKVFAPEELGLDESVGDVEVIYSNFKAPSVPGGLSPVIRIADDVFEFNSVQQSYIHTRQSKLRFIVFRSLPDEAVLAQQRQITEDEQLVKQAMVLLDEIKARHGKGSEQFKALVLSIREIQKRVRENRKALAKLRVGVATAAFQTPTPRTSAAPAGPAAPSAVRFVPRTKEAMLAALNTMFSNSVLKVTEVQGDLEFYYYPFKSGSAFVIGVNPAGRIRSFRLGTTYAPSPDPHDSFHWKGKMPHLGGIDFLDMGYEAGKNTLYFVARDNDLKEFIKLNGDSNKGTVNFVAGMGAMAAAYATGDVLFHWEIISESEAAARSEELKDILKFELGGVPVAAVVESLKRSEVRKNPDELKEKIEIAKRTINEMGRMAKNFAADYGETDTRTLITKKMLSDTEAELRRLEEELASIPLPKAPSFKERIQGLVRDETEITPQKIRQVFSGENPRINETYFTRTLEVWFSKENILHPALVADAELIVTSLDTFSGIVPRLFWNDWVVRLAGHDVYLKAMEKTSLFDKLVGHVMGDPYARDRNFGRRFLTRPVFRRKFVDMLQDENSWPGLSLKNPHAGGRFIEMAQWVLFLLETEPHGTELSQALGTTIPEWRHHEALNRGIYNSPVGKAARAVLKQFYANPDPAWEGALEAEAREMVRFLNDRELGPVVKEILGMESSETKRSEIRRQVSKEIVETALKAMQGIFAVAVARRNRELAIQELRTAWPELFAEEQAAVAYTSVLAQPAAAAQSPVRLVLAYQNLGKIDTAKLEVLEDFLARNPLASLMIQVSHAEPTALSDFQSRLQGNIVRIRQQAGAASKKVNLTVTASEKQALNFLSANHMRALVLSDEKKLLQRVKLAAPQKDNAEDILLVHDDSLSAGGRLKQASSMLAALDRLLSSHPMPEGIVSALSLLSQNLGLLNQVRALLARAA